MQWYIRLLPGWSGTEIKCTMHIVALPKLNQQRSRKQELRSYFPNIYSVVEKEGRIILWRKIAHHLPLRKCDLKQTWHHLQQEYQGGNFSDSSLLGKSKKTSTKVWKLWLKSTHFLCTFPVQNWIGCKVKNYNSVGKTAGSMQNDKEKYICTYFIFYQKASSPYILTDIKMVSA